MFRSLGFYLFIWKQYLVLIKAAFIWYKNSRNCKILLEFNNCFLCEYLLKCNLFLWSKLNFQHHYSSLQCHMIFRNHNNMLICCSRNISDYYQCWKQLCCTILFQHNKCINKKRYIEVNKKKKKKKKISFN